jgi:hypothetical protein
VERRMSDIRALAGEASNEAFPAVAKISELNEGLYDTFARPMLRAFATEAFAEWRRRSHPLRLRRTLASDRNPWMAWVSAAAEMVRPERRPAAADNPFLAMERRFADTVEESMARWREAQDAWSELAFHSVYGGLAALGIGDQPAARNDEAREAAVLDQAARRASLAAPEGGYAEAVVRMMIMLAEARGGVRRSRLERSNTLLTTTEPFRGMTSDQRQEMIRLQTLIVSLEPTLALETLPLLLPKAAERRRAIEAVAAVAGPEDELGDHARSMLARQRAVLGLAAQES